MHADSALINLHLTAATPNRFPWQLLRQHKRLVTEAEKGPILEEFGHLSKRYRPVSSQQTPIQLQYSKRSPNVLFFIV